MSSAFIKLPQDKLNAALAGVLCPRIEAILSDRGLGPCVRVTDLDDAVMESVCREFGLTETYLYSAVMTKKACLSE